MDVFQQLKTVIKKSSGEYNLSSVSFMKMILLYSNILETKMNEIDQKIERNKNGLSKINESQ